MLGINCRMTPFCDGLDCAVSKSRTCSSSSATEMDSGAVAYLTVREALDIYAVAA